MSLNEQASTQGKHRPDSSETDDYAPAAEVVAILANIQTEIGAGMVLIPKTAEDRAYNIACDRANKIIDNYKAGYGLFQMTARMKKGPLESGPRPATADSQARSKTKKGHPTA
jgi:hypothetical protein